MKYDFKVGVNVDASDLDKIEAKLTRIADLLDRINKPSNISFFDAEGELRLVVGPFVVEKNQVLINDASIELMKISNAKISDVIVSHVKAQKDQDDALKNSIREVVNELLDKASRPGGAIWRAIKNF